MKKKLWRVLLILIIVIIITIIIACLVRFKKGKENTFNNSKYIENQINLVLSLEDEITEEIIKEIPKYKSDFVDMKVVFKETGFSNDSEKMNAMQNLKQFGITDVRSV